MEHEFITMREACKILGVSRAMVQKLVASGELQRAREDGKLVFERAKVEALARAREVAKVQREQDAELREERQVEAQLHRRDVEFDAWVKRNEDEDVRRKYEHSQELLGSQLNQIRAKLQAIEEAEAYRQRDAAFAAFCSKPEPRAVDSMLADALAVLLPMAGLLMLTYWAGKQPEGGLPSPISPAAAVPIGGPGSVAAATVHADSTPVAETGPLGKEEDPG